VLKSLTCLQLDFLRQISSTVMVFIICTCSTINGGKNFPLQVRGGDFHPCPPPLNTALLCSYSLKTNLQSTIILSSLLLSPVWGQMGSGPLYGGSDEWKGTLGGPEPRWVISCEGVGHHIECSSSLGRLPLQGELWLELISGKLV
jgi:hypothetical protein